MIPIAAPQIGDEERNAVLAVLDSGFLAQGEIVAEFEKAFAAYVGSKHAVALSSGTAALHLALLAHGVGPGDEVITTPFTFVATANAILAVGAKPVFADIDPVTFNIVPELFERAITSRTRAIIPVHLFGNPADMTSICEIARHHSLVVVEDACQAHGAEHAGRKVGLFGTGCFSFYPTKNMTCGEGGMVTTNDDEVAERVRLLRNHGMKARYEYVTHGMNLRMTDIHAAIGIEQLKKLDRFNDRRRANAAALSAGLGESVVCPAEPWQGRHVYNQYTVRVPGGRADIQRRLAELGVGTAIYYPEPLHIIPHLADGNRYAEAERAAHEVISLPVHPGIDAEALVTVAHAVVSTVDPVRPLRK